MTSDRPEDFYRVYADFKRYVTPVIKAKHIRWYDEEFWRPARCTPAMSVLELGSGPGEFLLYLKRKGVARFLGVEMDRDAVAAMPEGLDAHIHVGDIWDYLAVADPAQKWDRIVLLDVLEHFSSPDGARLLERLGHVLAPGGLIIARVPNMGSPWGAGFQYGDLTHKAAYAAEGLRQLGLAAGYDTVGFVGQRRGTRMRRTLEGVLHGILDRILSFPPVVWSANIIVIYTRRSAAP